jgi:dTDP-4-amino-4,6-dideoxygalactose transaminase
MAIKRLSKSVVGHLEADALSKVILEDGYLGMGAEVGHFEKEIAAYLNVSESSVVCVNSGTSALHLAVSATVPIGGEVLVPSFTFLASYQAISGAGAVPISCEVYEDSLTINLEDAEKRITPLTKAIMPVFYASNPAKLDKIYEFASKHKLRVIEDAAHAFGCTYDNKKIGSFGDIICFSFDGIKNITSGEGGAIVTNDELVLDFVKDGRLLGVIKDSEKRYAGKRSWDFDVISQGYRFHMSNLFAAIGRVQLKRFDNEFAPKRKLLQDLYKKELSNNPDIIMQTQEPRAMIVPHIFPILVQNQQRDGLIKWLNEQQIQTGMHYKPNHLLTFYGGGKECLPITEQIYDKIVTLPLHPELDEEDVKMICLSINKYFKSLK